MTVTKCPYGSCRRRRGGCLIRYVVFTSAGAHVGCYGMVVAACKNAEDVVWCDAPRELWS